MKTIERTEMNYSSKSITRDYLRRISRNVLDFLNKKNIVSLSDLETVMGRQFSTDIGEYILVSYGPSEQGIAHVIDYIAPPKGIPLEIRINRGSMYSKIIFKGNFNLPGYTPFGSDPFDNIAQEKKLDSTDIVRIKSELESLVKNCDLLES
jgi:hypothetical protein